MRALLDMTVRERLILEACAVILSEDIGGILCMEFNPISDGSNSGDSHGLHSLADVTQIP